MGTRKKAGATAQRRGASAGDSSGSASSSVVDPANIVEAASKQFRLVREGKGAIALVVLFGVAAAVLKVVDLEGWLRDVLLPVAATVVVMAVCALVVATLSTDRRARKILGYTLTGLIAVLLLVGTGVIAVLAWRFALPGEVETFDAHVPLVNQDDPTESIDGTLTLRVDERDGISARIADDEAVFRKLPKNLLGEKATIRLASEAVEFWRPADGDTSPISIVLQAQNQAIKVVSKNAFKGTVQYQGRPAKGVTLIIDPFGCEGTTDASGRFLVKCVPALKENSPKVMVLPPETLSLLCKSTTISPAGKYSSIDLGLTCSPKPAEPDEPEGPKTGASSGGRPADPALAQKIRNDCAKLTTQLQAQYGDGPRRTITVGDGTLSCSTCGDLSTMKEWAHEACDPVTVGKLAP